MLTGWKEIEQHVGLTQKVLRPLIETEGVPIRYIGKKPVTTPELLDEWVVRYVTGENGKTRQ
jgi:hypothetical protein